jgi:hypothetical protein
MRPDEQPNNYYNRIHEAVKVVKIRDVDVDNDRNYTEQAKVLRMVKELDSVRFGVLQLTQDQKGGS